MTSEEILDQAIAMLQRRGRMTYRTLERQFTLDDDAFVDLKDALLYPHPEIRDDAGRGLVWTGAPSLAPPATSPPASAQDHAALSYTPSYLAEKILTSRSTLEGERKQVTVLFADLKGSTDWPKAWCRSMPWDRFRSKGWPSRWRSWSWSGPVPSVGVCRPVRHGGSPTL